MLNSSRVLNKIPLASAVPSIGLPRPTFCFQSVRWALRQPESPPIGRKGKSTGMRAGSCHSASNTSFSCPGEFALKTASQVLSVEVARRPMRRKRILLFHLLVGMEEGGTWLEQAVNFELCSWEMEHMARLLCACSHSLSDLSSAIRVIKQAFQPRECRTLEAGSTAVERTP